MVDECYRILAADDDPAVRKAYQMLFEPDPVDPLLEQLLGHEATQADQGPCLQLTTVAQGVDAVEQVRESIAANDPFSVVLMDVRMPPGIDGIEAARQIQEIDRNLFLVIVTAYSDYSLEMAEGILRGNFTILSKPFDKNELVKLVHHNVNSWKLNRQFSEKFMK